MALEEGCSMAKYTPRQSPINSKRSIREVILRLFGGPITHGPCPCPSDIDQWWDLTAMIPAGQAHVRVPYILAEAGKTEGRSAGSTMSIGVDKHETAARWSSVDEGTRT